VAAYQASVTDENATEPEDSGLEQPLPEAENFHGDQDEFGHNYYHREFTEQGDQSYDYEEPFVGFVGIEFFRRDCKEQFLSNFKLHKASSRYQLPEEAFTDRETEEAFIDRGTEGT